MKGILLLVFTLLLYSRTGYSQDVIIRTSGDTIFCNIKSVDSTRVNFTIENNGETINTYLDLKDIRSYESNFHNSKYPNSARYQSGQLDKLAVGFGIGVDFAGLGLNFLYYPQRNIGLYVSVGFAIVDVQYCGGLKLRMSSKEKKRKVVPYFLFNYGYNAAILVDIGSSLNKFYYGPTLGFGLDFVGKSNRKGYWSLSIMAPIRDSEVYSYINYLKNDKNIEFINELWPVTFTVSYRKILL